LAGLEGSDVVCEDLFGGLGGAPTSQLPLPERRKIPDADVSSNGVVFTLRIPEVIYPEPTFPLDEPGTGPAVHLGEIRSSLLGKLSRRLPRRGHRSAAIVPRQTGAASDSSAQGVAVMAAVGFLLPISRANVKPAG